MKTLLSTIALAVICSSAPCAIAQTSTWTGSAGSSWNNSGNWSTGSVPNAATNVIIPAGTANVPAASGGNFSAKNLTVAAGAHVSVAGDATIDVKGTMTNNGLVDGNGAINLSGSATQALHGRGTISNLSLDNSNGAYINTADTIYITGDLTLSNGNLATNNGLVLRSDESGTGSTNYTQKFTIKAENMVLPEGAQLFLHDKLTATYTALVQGTEYSFNITKDTATQGNNRFELTTALPASTSDVAINTHTTISPNPATNYITIAFQNAEATAKQINIMNALGTTVTSKTVNAQQGEKVTMDISHLPSGIYLVETIAGNDKITQKLIKN